MDLRNISTLQYYIQKNKVQYSKKKKKPLADSLVMKAIKFQPNENCFGRSVGWSE